MTDFTVTITDPAQLDGITWSREQHNASLPIDESNNPTELPIATDAEYVQYVMEMAAASYAQQQYDAGWREAYENGTTPPTRRT